MRILLNALMLTMLVHPVWSDDHFSSYEECLTKSLKGVTNDKAVDLINKACVTAAEKAQAERLALIAALKEAQAENLSQIAALKEAQAESLSQIAALKEAQAESLSQIAALNGDTKKLHVEIELLRRKLDAGGEKASKETPKEEVFETIYHEFPGTFRTILSGSRKVLEVGIGVSTQYDDTVMMNVESHQLALRSVILGVMSDFSEDDVKGAAGRDKLAVALRDAINTKLEELENFGGIEEAHFTSFVIQ